CVPIDVRVSFMKLYPRSEVGKRSSLNFYLKECGLVGKVDMSIPAMNKIYETANVEGMRKVSEYCIKDALSCQELMVKRNIINDYREKASIAHIPLFDDYATYGLG
ncbi:9334_t:CDS:1, partial [Paraglomus brasilianum]